MLNGSVSDGTFPENSLFVNFELPYLRKNEVSKVQIWVMDEVEGPDVLCRRSEASSEFSTLLLSAVTALSQTAMNEGCKTVDGEPLAAMITQLSLGSRKRTCSILLTNRSSRILINPQVCMNNGYCASPPELTVDQGARSIFAFATGNGSMNGADGVVTYDITENRKKKADERLAIMFSVPTDYDKRDNWFAIGFFDLSQPCDSALYKMMYENSGTFRREKPFGSEICYEGEKYIIRGAMTPIRNGEVKVELWDKEFC